MNLLEEFGEWPPEGVWAVASVSACMAINSFILGNIDPPSASVSEKLLWIIHSDMFEIQNLGHSAFLLMFATSWWKNQNITGAYMCQLSSLYALPVLASFVAIGLHLYFQNSQSASISSHNCYLFIGVIWTSVHMLCLLVAAMVTANRNFAKKYSILNPLTYTTNDKYSFLRKLMLFQILISIVEPLALAVSRLSSEWTTTMRVEIDSQPALALRGYMESYTLAFHQAFAMSVAFSQISIPDEDKDVYAVCFATVAQLICALGFLFGSSLIPSDMAFFGTNFVKIVTHIGLTWGFWNMTVGVFNQQQQLGKLRYVPNLSVSRNDVEHEHEYMRDPNHKALWTIAFRMHEGLSNTTVQFAKLAFGISIAFGLWWQIQACFLVSLAHRSGYQEIDAANSLRYGLNFGMHGAGITVFDMLLCFRNLKSWRFMKYAAIGGCFGGAISSIGHVFRINAIEQHQDKLSVMVFFGTRAAISIFFGLALSKLDFEKENLYSMLESEQGKENPSPSNSKELKPPLKKSTKRVKERKRIEAVPVPLSQFLRGYASNGEMYALCIYFISVLFYSASVVWRFRNAGALSSGFFYTDAQPGGGWRILEFAPGYGLVFHFCLILGSFASSWFQFRFEPSRWIAIFFTGSSMLIGAYQIFVLGFSDFDWTNALVMAASLFVSASGAVLIWYLYTGNVQHGFKVHIADLWY